MADSRSRYVSDGRANTAPALPADRPPTKQEVWDYFSHVFSDTKRRDDLIGFCRDYWVWSYVDFVNRRGWDKQPDWIPGQPVKSFAVPSQTFKAGEPHNWLVTVQHCWEKANAR